METGVNLAGRAIAALLYLSGLVTSIPDPIDRGIALGVNWIVRAFVLAVLVDIFFVPIIWLAEKSLETLTQRWVRYETYTDFGSLGRLPKSVATR